MSTHWMDKILHHFETMRNHGLLLFTGESSNTRVSERWCQRGFATINSMGSTLINWLDDEHMGVGQKEATRGPLGLVFASIYQGNPFWVFDSQPYGVSMN